VKWGTPAPLFRAVNRKGGHVLALNMSGNIFEVINTLGQIVEVRVYCTEGDQTAVNVRHFEVTSVAGTGTMFSDMLQYYDGLFMASYPQLLNGGAFYSGLTLQRIFPGPKSSLAYGSQTAGAGTGGADPLPSQVCGVVSFRSPLSGPRNRGRMYVPFPPKALCDADGTPTPGYLDGLDGLGDVFTGTDEIGGGGNSVQQSSIILHRADMTRTRFIQWVRRDKWGTQRRRGNYGKPNESPV